MSSLRRVTGRGSLGLYRLLVRAKGKAFSTACGGAFAAFGARSVIEPPVRILGERWISVGADVFVGAGSYLQVLYGAHGAGRLAIGDGTSVTGMCVLSAAQEVVIGRNVLLARNVYVADHRHAFEDTSLPVLAQGIAQVGPVAIGDGAWLGQNVVVGPGVRIGAGAVIGANSVVLDDVPPHAVAVGAPARVVRRFGAAERAAA